MRAESVRSGPCEAKIGEANSVSNTRVLGHPRKKRSDVFSEFRGGSGDRERGDTGTSARIGRRDG